MELYSAVEDTIVSGEMNIANVDVELLGDNLDDSDEDSHLVDTSKLNSLGESVLPMGIPCGRIDVLAVARLEEIGCFAVTSVDSDYSVLRLMA